MDAAAVRRIRNALGLSQEEFAQRIGVARNTVARWEMGMHSVPGPAARLIEQMKRGTRKGVRRSGR